MSADRQPGLWRALAMAFLLKRFAEADHRRYLEATGDTAEGRLRRALREPESTTGEQALDR